MEINNIINDPLSFNMSSIIETVFNSIYKTDSYQNDSLLNNYYYKWFKATIYPDIYYMLHKYGVCDYFYILGEFSLYCLDNESKLEDDICILIFLPFFDRVSLLNLGATYCCTLSGYLFYICVMNEHFLLDDHQVSIIFFSYMFKGNPLKSLPYELYFFTKLINLSCNYVINVKSNTIIPLTFRKDSNLFTKLSYKSVKFNGRMSSLEARSIYEIFRHYAGNKPPFYLYNLNWAYHSPQPWTFLSFHKHCSLFHGYRL